MGTIEQCTEEYEQEAKEESLIMVGDELVLTADIIEPASGDHPEFLLGKKNEIVKVLKCEPIQGVYAYLVEGPTNPGKPWRAGVGDFTPKPP